ncbi:butyrophilin subfamily 3 member A2-like [Polypterus senegalus]|uniref:butyrophilin subfamily 3 member A2-like n=1 Tax=Polypterus senegalus TaxID=55291 RepID=UPI001964F6BF|nr:butyrophilin subfamily 3 member A2-like [Polypterus senegalus]
MHKRYLQIIILLMAESLYGLPGDIVGNVGESSILPCVSQDSSSGKQVNLKEINFAWKKLPDTDMLVFSDGEEIVDPGYAGRVNLFKDQLAHGNFSLLFLNIKKTDEGDYRCYLPQGQPSQDIKFTVNEMERFTGVTEKGRTLGEETGNSGANLMPQKYLAFLISVLFLHHYVE